MERSIRILVVSNTPWDDSNSFGSSFSNILGGESRYEIANIYCQPGWPNTQVAKRFFRISEKSIIRSLVKKAKSSGEEVANHPGVVNQDSETVKKAKHIRWQLFFWIRDLIWVTGKWHSAELDRFIDDFQPDIVFQPLYFQPHINRIGIYAAQRANVPMVGYTSDDNYSLRQYNWSPLFWIDRLIKRRLFKKAVSHCRLLDVITETQRKEYDRYFGKGKCKVLYKGGDFSHPIPKMMTNHPIRFLYTGNLGAGRWETLAQIAKEIHKLNANGRKAQLEIYSATSLSPAILSQLDIPDSSEFKGRVSAIEIKPLQQKADVLIHVEPFKKTERYKARLSFSTKIVDYMEAGKCILAVGWKETGGIEYLATNNAACCITDPAEIGQTLSQLVEKKELRQQYAINAYELGRKNHNLPDIHTCLYRNLNETANKKSI